MKATHLFHQLYPVTVENHPKFEELAFITYVGPEVPHNRRIGQRVQASRTVLFTGEPSLTPIGEGNEKDKASNG